MDDREKIASLESRIATLEERISELAAEVASLRKASGGQTKAIKALQPKPSAIRR